MTVPQMTFFPLDNIGVAIVSNMDDVADSFYPIVLYAYDLLMVRPCTSLPCSQVQ